MRQNLRRIVCAKAKAQFSWFSSETYLHLTVYQEMFTFIWCLTAFRRNTVTVMSVLEWLKTRQMFVFTIYSRTRRTILLVGENKSNIWPQNMKTTSNCNENLKIHLNSFKIWCFFRSEAQKYLLHTFLDHFFYV